MQEKAKHPVRTAEKTLDIIDQLKEQEGGRLTDLAEALDMGPSAVHNHLSTLMEHGYVVKEGEEYRLSLKFLELGGFTRNQVDLFKVAEPEIERLAEQTGELVNLMTEERGMGVYLKRSKGQDALDLDTYAGMRVHLHTTALGKAILAHLPTERLDEIIDFHGLPAHTEKTISTREELDATLERVRERGYAIDNGERLKGLRCVAAPVMQDDSTVLGSISVSAPANRLNDRQLDDELPKMIRGAANVIELNIRY